MPNVLEYKNKHTRFIIKHIEHIIQVKGDYNVRHITCRLSFDLFLYSANVCRKETFCLRRKAVASFGPFCHKMLPNATNKKGWRHQSSNPVTIGPPSRRRRCYVLISSHGVSRMPYCPADVLQTAGTTSLVLRCHPSPGKSV